MAEPGTFVVEAVRGRRRRKHKLQYLVEWKGYPAAADQTWEPLANLDGCGAKVDEFAKRPTISHESYFCSTLSILADS